MRAFLFLTAISLFGQPPPSPSDGYATTDDGSQMYFVSSFVLRGSTGETTYPKMFKYDGPNFSLVTQIPHTLGTLEFYAVLEPRVSGDGSVVGYVATPGCGDSCPVAGGFQTTLHVSQPPNQAGAVFVVLGIPLSATQTVPLDLWMNANQ